MKCNSSTPGAWNDYNPNTNKWLNGWVLLKIISMNTGYTRFGFK